MIRRFVQFGQKHPHLWALAWVVWFIVLWILSSGTPGSKGLHKIPHIDKVLHFGYFFGGGGLLCAWLRHSCQRRAVHCIWITTLVGAVIGVIDEHHQSFTPGRTGNDAFDWIADTTGALAGAIVMVLVLKSSSAWQRKQPKLQATG